ncbi:MAG: DNA polymerase III subunit gamma/tau [Clostridiaceae bacterium]
MAYTALYREWRPKNFNEVVGQKHITQTVKNQVKNNRIAHAYLFCGTRGTGKTSTAKILAKAVNCLNPVDGEPCNECDMCKKINAGTLIDVTELDAASNNGVDRIRDIIEDVLYPPREGRYKVYIMDEVHMLSTGAVNAFLKTLEEPPSYVIFILATTDPQKLPVTILSRCQRFDFKRIKKEEIFDRLRKIVKNQGVYADDNSLNLIARMADGAMRDALSILDQAISMGGGKVDYDLVINMLGLVTNDNILKLTDAVIEKNIEKTMKLVDDIIYSGKDINTFIKDLITHFRNLMMVKVSKKPEEVLDMSLENIELIKEQSSRIRVEEIMRYIKILQEAEEESKWSKQSRIYLELALIKMCKVEYDSSPEMMLSRINKLEDAIKKGNIAVSCERIVTKKDNKIQEWKDEEGTLVCNTEDEVVKLRPEDKFNENSALTLDIVKKSWQDILDVFKSRRQMVLYASLVTGELVDCKDGVVTIKFGKNYSFNKKRLDKGDNGKLVDEVFSYALKEKVRIEYIIEKSIEEKDTEKVLKETFGDILEIIDD